MNFKLFCAIALLQLVSARNTFVPKFLGEDSAVIVDANRAAPDATSKHRHRQQQQHHQQNQKSHHFRLLPMHFPVYQIIPNNNNQQRGKEFVPLTATHTTSSKAPPSSTSKPTSVSIFTKEEFPNDLIDIAHNKLGIKNLDEIPSVSELGELLGTQNAEETIKYIRDLTATEEGIEFVKAYIESTDYTDSTGTGGTGIVTATDTTADNQTTAPTDVKLPDDATEQPQQSLYERLAAYLNFFELFTTKTTTAAPKTDNDEMNLQRIDTHVSRDENSRVPNVDGMKINNMINLKRNDMQKPILVRNPLPYHYPIPIRPIVVYRPRGSAAVTSPFNHLQSAVHLNTPKVLVPQITEAALPLRKSNKSQHRQQQQLNDLAARVSKFPLTNDREALVDAQYVNAIEKAFAEDEDLKNILGSTETLK